MLIQKCSSGTELTTYQYCRALPSYEAHNAANSSIDLKDNREINLSK